MNKEKLAPPQTRPDRRPDKKSLNKQIPINRPMDSLSEITKGLVARRDAGELSEEDFRLVHGGAVIQEQQRATARSQTQGRPSADEFLARLKRVSPEERNGTRSMNTKKSRFFLIGAIAAISIFCGSCGGKSDYPHFKKGEKVSVKTDTFLDGLWLGESKDAVSIEMESGGVLAIKKSRIKLIRGYGNE